MKIIQLILMKLLSAVALVLGIVLIAAAFTGRYPVIDEIRTEYQSWPPFFRGLAWFVTAVALVFIGFIGLMPWGRGRRARQVSFAGPHGDVFYDLDSIEKTINRVVGRMPEVTSIASRVTPADERRVEVNADVVLNPTGIGARDAASLVSRQIENAAEQMLGEDGVTRVVLHVKKIHVDLKAPLPITDKAGHAAAAPSPHDAVQEIHGLEEAEREAEEERRAAAAHQAPRETFAAPAEPVVSPAAAREPGPEESYTYLPEEEEEEPPVTPAEEPLLKDEQPGVGLIDDERAEESPFEDRRDDEPNLPPLESFRDEEESGKRDNPFR